MAKKLIAMLLAMTFVALVFAACGSKEAPETTDAPEATTEEVVTEAPVEDTTAAPAEETTAAPADETTAAPAEETTAAPAETTTAVVSDPKAAETTKAEETTEAAKKAPKTKAEIVAYYNEVINKAKKDSKSITSNYMRHAVAGEITGIPSALDSIGQKLIKDNMGEDKSKTNVTWSTTADKNANFPVEGETYASKLTEADVQSATCTEKNGVYTITITTVADPKSSDYKHGQGHAPKAFNVVLPSIIDGYIPGLAKSLFSVGTVSCAYPSSTVKITVDAKTDQVKTANYLMKWTLYIPLNGKDVVLPFSTENDYKINW